MLRVCIVLGWYMLASGCLAYEIPAEIQWESKDQIWLLEESQVQLRAVQTRMFDTYDRARIFGAVISTLQDLDLQVDVVDEELGVISAKKLVPSDWAGWSHDRWYYLYDEEELLIFTKNNRSWGAFAHRNDLLRVTVTIRSRSEKQLIVRASAQFYLQAIKDPEPYQKFFRSLEQALFLEAHLLQ